MSAQTPDFGTTGGRLRLLVLQPTSFCNIDCSYCYLSNRRSVARMSAETLALVCTRVFESPFLDRHLEIAWHGGEPLAVPITWYEDAIATIEQRRPASLQIKHRFQTNGLLLNERWARFFAQTGAILGVSIDGPADLHDANRRTRGGRGTHDQVMRSIRLLQSHGIDFQVITVLTERTLDHPDRLFEFYVQNGIKNIGFNIEEIEGANVSSSLARIGTEAKFRQFMRRFFKLAWESPTLLRVRELEATIGHLLSDEPVRDEQNLPFAVVNISHDGTVSTFSPELLGARHPRFGSFAFGHVRTTSLRDIDHAPLFQQINSEIRRGIEVCQRNCPYFRWCGGGAPANKLFETGRFDASETMHCRLTRQLVIDEVLARLESEASTSTVHSTH